MTRAFGSPFEFLDPLVKQAGWSPRDEVNPWRVASPHPRWIEAIEDFVILTYFPGAGLHDSGLFHDANSLVADFGGVRGLDVTGEATSLEFPFTPAQLFEEVAKGSSSVRTELNSAPPAPPTFFVTRNP